MEKAVLQEVMAKTEELIKAPTCSAEAGDAARKWLDAAKAGKEEEETKSYIAELKEDLIPIDGLIAFAESEDGAKVFGADQAPQVAEHGREIKAQGAKYCDCPACAAVEAILKTLKEI